MNAQAMRAGLIAGAVTGVGAALCILLIHPAGLPLLIGAALAVAAGDAAAGLVVPDVAVRLGVATDECALGAVVRDSVPAGGTTLRERDGAPGRPDVGCGCGGVDPVAVPADGDGCRCVGPTGDGPSDGRGDGAVRTGSMWNGVRSLTTFDTSRCA